MLKSIGKQFKKPSGFGGKIISKVMKKGNRIAYDYLIDKMDIQKDDRLFEIGYGHGIGIKKILTENNCQIGGIDFSELMHKEALKRNKEEVNESRANLIFGDFLTYSMETEKYDKIFCINVIYFWDDLVIPFIKIRQGLKAGGKFHFYMNHRDDLNRLKFTKDDIFNKYEIDNVIEKLKIAGFSKVKYECNKGYFIECMQ